MPNKSCAFSAICIFFFLTHNKYNLRKPLKRGNKGIDLENKSLVSSLVACGRTELSINLKTMRSSKVRVVGLWEASPARAVSSPLKIAASHRGKQWADWHI